MRLKTLEISGFKSFARKVNLDFESSISAIVGPNGSGKSNIAEAFRFVLGEQSMKSLRGKKGEDLIFNGTGGTGRQNKASVKITLDNADRSVPVDFDDVTLERVVHRDGVNEYLVNGSQVRLKDVIELLASSNVGSTGHHIISQGEADKILNTTPKERRSMLEDALGLRIFQYKKSESDRKLLKTEENIKQVQSLRKEIAPHIRFLQKQVDKIEAGKEVKNRLTDFYKTYLKREKIFLDDKEVRIRSELKAPEEELGEINRNLEKNRRELENTNSDSSGRDFDTSDLEKELSDYSSRKNELLRSVGSIEGEIGSLQRIAEKQENSDVKVSIKEIEELKDDIYRLMNEGSEDVSVLKNIISKIKETFDDFIKVRGLKKEGGDEYKLDINELKNKRTKTEEEIKELEQKEEDFKNKINNLRTELEQEKTGSLEAEKKILELVARKNEIEGGLARLRVEKQTLQMEQEDFKREITEAGVLIGREVVGYEDTDISKEEVLDEDRTTQLERRRELEKMKIKVEELGGAGSDEILREHEEVSERDAFLITEVEDLEKSASSLRELITDLEGKINTRFQEGIVKINKEFQNFFELMFGGGDAALRLVKPEVKKNKKDSDLSLDGLGDEPSEELEEDNEVQEGVDIHVSLPRKKIKGLMMLSGGERALTSIALIFAMSQVNPPPFIILDETDAALDEANSRKYSDMIENLSEHSQLILITHNRETMSRAGIIYGVTMETGVSQLLSIKFDEGAQYAK